jgi:uncharacterized protein YcbK (DUF882 family)
MLKAMLLTTPTILLITKPSLSMASVAETRALSFRHLHTNEKLSIKYFSENNYQPDSLSKINHFLRDFRSSEVYPIDPQLLDFLYSIKQLTGSKGHFEIISGFRSSSTNEMLRGKSTGVAKRSFHMKGQAVDVRLTDIKTDALRQAAIALKAGGVGFYKKSNFVHLDTGRFRNW